MAERRPTRREIEQQIEALQGQLDTADDGDEVWVRDDRGREVRVTGRRAAGILARLGFGDDDDGDDGDGGDAGDGGADPRPGGGGYFSGRRRR